MNELTTKRNGKRIGVVLVMITNDYGEIPGAILVAYLRVSH